jgi:ribonuclease HI
VIIFKIDFILVKYIDTNDINMVTIYTDGSCLKNPGPGGWAFCIVDDSDSYTCMSGSESNTTNNRMELTAIIESLAMIQDNECNIYSDSLLTINCAQNIWKRKANLDLWNKYDKISKNRRINYTWVKAHNGNKYNEIVDKLAYKEASNI